MNKDYFSILFTQDMVMQIGISSIAAHRSIRVAAPSGPDFCCLRAAGLDIDLLEAKGAPDL